MEEEMTQIYKDLISDYKRQKVELELLYKEIAYLQGRCWVLSIALFVIIIGFGIHDLVVNL